LCLIVGTEATFGYTVHWALQAREAGAMLVDVNPRDTGLGSLVDIHLQGKAGEVLPKLIDRECRMQKSETRMQNSRPGKQKPDVGFDNGI